MDYKWSFWSHWESCPGRDFVSSAAHPCTKSSLWVSRNEDPSELISALEVTWNWGLIMARLLRTAILVTCLFCAGNAFAQGGTCPAGTPGTGNNCYFVATNGSDTNSGASESSPWLHAPGMPNCANTCAGVTPSAGMGFIFRGGDTWHFGNSSATPYTGGGWNLKNWHGTDASCIYGSIQTGCIYYGVDKNWFSGGSWQRPILTGDNPTSTSTVAGCAYQVAGSFWYDNTMVMVGWATIFDNFEMTGMCSSDSVVQSGSGNVYYAYAGTGTSASGMAFIENVYIHGWTETSTAGTGNGGNVAGTLIGGGGNGLQTLDHIVIDGSDSDPSRWAWGQYPSYYHFRDSMIRYTTDGVGQICHDIHDNIFEHVVPIFTGGHTNILECNEDSHGDAVNQPQNTPNVWYNNVVRHSNSNVMMWVCPNTMPEYYFNNLVYDSAGEGWSIAGAPGYSSCPNTGGQFMFNNTFVDGNSGGYSHPCHLSGSNGTGGQYLTVLNEHLINTSWDGTGCTGGASSATNVSMSTSTASSQGYISGSGIYTTNNCSNDSTTPCAPTAVGYSTVGVGGNHQAYCTTLASYSGENAISAEAANACRYGTTDGCAYNVSTHTMNCPGQTPVARPTTLAWDAGAYQFSATQAKLPQPPTSLLATVN